MSDYISREAAIQAIVVNSVKHAADPEHTIDPEVAAEIIYAVQKLPAADVRENKRGRNITEENPVDQFVCSECGLILEGYYRREIDHDDGYEIYYEFTPRFCPNCGADMREEQT